MMHPRMPGRLWASLGQRVRQTPATVFLSLGRPWQRPHLSCLGHQNTEARLYWSLPFVTCALLSKRKGSLLSSQVPGPAEKPPFSCLAEAGRRGHPASVH